MATKKVKQVKKMLLQKKKPPRKLTNADFLSTGSTQLNLACSGRSRGGFKKGGYYLLVGDSDSGKTFLTMTCLAEAAKNPEFDDYDFIFDAPEDGVQMDVKRFFGEAVAKRLRAPAHDKAGGPIYSETTEDFYYYLDDLQKAGRKFIYILDSMDAIDTDQDEAKFAEQKKASRAGKTTTGSYGMSKSKVNSQNIRRVVRRLRKSGSILIVITQTRAAQSMYEEKTRGGGHALKFYAHLEMWTRPVQKLYKVINGKKRQYGIVCRIDVKKNRFVGFKASAEIPIYPSFGMDDIGSCISYLVGEKHWKSTADKISAPEFKFKGTTTALIRKIEDEDLQPELQTIVSKVWHAIIDKLSLKRKPRYV